MFGSKRRFVRRCECDTLWPKPGPLAQMSQTAATVTPEVHGVDVDWAPDEDTLSSNRTRVADRPAAAPIRRNLAGCLPLSPAGYSNSDRTRPNGSTVLEECHEHLNG